ncbi:MAG: SufD family Fe-S cluster assembly protein [Pseudomonadota bacterium]
MVDPIVLADSARVPNWLTKTPGDLQSSIAAASVTRIQAERWKYLSLAKAWPSQNTLSPSDLIFVPPPSGTAASTSTHRPNETALEALDSDVDILSPRLANAPDAIARLCNADFINKTYVQPGGHATVSLLRQAHQAPTIIILGEGSTLELNETVSPEVTHLQDDVWLILRKGAKVVHSRSNFGGSNSHLYRFLSVTLEAKASYQLHNHSCGCELHRQDIHIDLSGSGAHVDIQGANLVPAASHLDQHIVMTHAHADSQSNQRVHTIAGAGSKVTFNGRILIKKGCPGVEAHLNNRNLSLSDVATINTKPELEIYTDDVACSHGATIGKLDESHLFYFASRGVDELTAKRLLAQGFLATCVSGPMAQQAQVVLSDLAAAENQPS